MKFSAKRRKFLTESTRTAAGVGVAALMLGLYARQSRALPADAIRPPGALEEDSFLGACIRCGLCVRDCPYDTLKLAELGDVTVGVEQHPPGIRADEEVRPERDQDQDQQHVARRAAGRRRHRRDPRQDRRE